MTVRKTTSLKRNTAQHSKHQKTQPKGKSVTMYPAWCGIKQFAKYVQKLAKCAQTHPTDHGSDRSPMDTLSDFAKQYMPHVWIPPYILCGGFDNATKPTSFYELPDMSKTELDCILAAHAKRPSTLLLLCGRVYTPEDKTIKPVLFIGLPKTTTASHHHWMCMMLPGFGDSLGSNNEAAMMRYFYSHGVAVLFVRQNIFRGYAKLAALIGERETEAIEWNSFLVLMLAGVLDMIFSNKHTATATTDTSSNELVENGFTLLNSYMNHPQFLKQYTLLHDIAKLFRT